MLNDLGTATPELLLDRLRGRRPRQWTYVSDRVLANVVLDVGVPFKTIDINLMSEPHNYTLCTFGPRPYNALLCVESWVVEAWYSRVIGGLPYLPTEIFGAAEHYEASRAVHKLGGFEAVCAYYVEHLVPKATL